MFNVDSTQKIIFCEGEVDGPDFAVFTVLLGTNPHIQPIGNKDAITKFVQGYFGEDYKKAKANKRFFIIRDRDLDRKSPDGKLQQFSDTVYLTGVTTIECYFLDAMLLQKYADRTKYPEHMNKELLQQTLDLALNKLKKYQAIRWALQDIRDYMMENARKEGLIRTTTLDLGNTLSDRSKNNFDKTDMELVGEAKEQIKKLASVIQYLGEPVLGELEAKYDHYQNQFSQFSTQTDEYKYWFDGKEVMHRWFEEIHSNGINIEQLKYYQQCAKEIDFNRYPDLIEFRNICRG